LFTTEHCVTSTISLTCMKSSEPNLVACILIV
jgi:hypothetical protein